MNTAKKICFEMVFCSIILAASNAHADTVNYTLDNLILAGGEQITGTFDWTFNVGDFEGGSGVFTALEIPYTRYSFADGNLNMEIQTSSIEISGNGNYHDVGLDITLKFLSQSFTPTQSAPIDLDLSFFECCGNGFRDQPFQSGSISPTAVPEPLTVVGRHVFYNNSAFDSKGTLADNDAVATDKRALLPGHTASFDNYTRYANGINGVMSDVANLPDGVTFDAEDFRFKVGNDNTPNDWGNAPDPIGVTTRAGEGGDDSDRIVITWGDNAVDNQWLQVSMLANDQTGLLEDDVFYFGNAIGESGNSTIDAKVNAFDILGARDNQRTFLNPAPIDFDLDFNRDARVNAADMLIARNNQTHFLNALPLISVPSAKLAAVPEPSTLAVLGVCAVGLLTCTWRRRRN